MYTLCRFYLSFYALYMYTRIECWGWKKVEIVRRETVWVYELIGKVVINVWCIVDSDSIFCYSLTTCNTQINSTYRVYTQYEAYETEYGFEINQTL